MNIVRITKQITEKLVGDILTKYPYLAQNADGRSYLYKDKPTINHRGFWEGERYSEDPIMDKPYSNDWEESVLFFDEKKKLASLGEGAFFVPATESKSVEFRKAFTEARVELHGVFTHV